MAELIGKHSIKIQIVVLIGFIVSSVATSWNFGYKTSEITSAVAANTVSIEKMEPHVQEVPVLRQMYSDIKEDVRDIKEILNKK